MVDNVIKVHVNKARFAEVYRGLGGSLREGDDRLEILVRVAAEMEVGKFRENAQVGKLSNF